MRSALPLGIMQGRLLSPINGRIQCFPAANWREEFALVKAAGLDLIEWIFEVYGAEQNPIADDNALAELKDLSRQHGVAIRSLCADYFMDRPLLTTGAEGVEKLRWLLKRCSLAGIRRIILPFVDASRIPHRDAANVVIALLGEVTEEAKRLHVELHLETDLPPKEFADLMTLLPEPIFKINYDSGNSASHGYEIMEEFRAYGERIGSLHIKDRVRGGGTVPLGDGNADFTALRCALDSINYHDDVILQVARGSDGNELEWIRGIRKTVEKMLFEPKV